MFADRAIQLPLLLAISWREKLASMSALELVLWIGLATLTFALLVLMLTRWGQVRPVSKCVALSVFAHLLFLFYAYGTRLDFEPGSLAGSPTVRVTYLEPEFADSWEAMVAPDERSVQPETPLPPVEQLFVTEADPAETQPPADLEPQPAASDDTAPALMTPDADMAETQESAFTPEMVQAEPTQEEPSSEMTETPAEPPAEAETDYPPIPEIVIAVPDHEPTPAAASAPLVENPAPPETPDANVPVEPTASERPAEALASQDAATIPLPSALRPADRMPLPEPYRMRVAPDRLQFALPFGATADTEAAVAAALVWLAAQQESDGRWDASLFGAGRETKALGQDRKGAGADADTGISGLVLLAFLGAGHTHLSGDYGPTMQHGLQYLLRIQGTDGNLAGDAKQFERMYCHGMALLALSEAYGMTGDPRLADALRRGVRYTFTAQDRVSGGWRYQPGERGDMSQFGWQLLALRSAELAGLPIPDANRALMVKFLDSVTYGNHRGLASYRPGERPTRTMSAEAMVCRYFLSMPTTAASTQETIDFVLQELPGQDEANLYYWYYATLALFQVQGPAWQVWNESLQHNLLSRQQQHGPLAGSWDTRDVWGGYGGRLYTTAVATLCFEVYYRYLPLHDPTREIRQADAAPVPEWLRR